MKSVISLLNNLLLSFNELNSDKLISCQLEYCEQIKSRTFLYPFSLSFNRKINNKLDNNNNNNYNNINKK